MGGQGGLVVALLLLVGMTLAGTVPPATIRVAVLKAVDSSFTSELALQAEEHLMDKFGAPIQVLFQDQPDHPLDYFANIRSKNIPNNDFDVYFVDALWASSLAGSFIDPRTLSATNASLCSSELEGCDYLPHFLDLYFDGVGQLSAVPMFGTLGLLYTREDLLDLFPQVAHPPYSTYTDLSAAAAAILLSDPLPDPALRAGFLVGLSDPTSMMATVIEWVTSNDGGRVFNTRGTVTVNNPQASNAFWNAIRWVDSGLAPSEALHRSEADVAALFRACTGVFMRNVPSAMPSIEPSDMRCSSGSPRVSISQLPGSSVAGGWGLAIAKSSNMQEYAAELVAFLTSADLQLNRALNQFYFPSRSSAFTTLCTVSAPSFAGCGIYNATLTTVRQSLPADPSRTQDVTKYLNAWMGAQLRETHDRDTLNANLLTLHRDLTSVASVSGDGMTCGTVYGINIHCAPGLTCINGTCLNRKPLITGLSVPFSLIGALIVILLILFPFRKRAALLRWNAHAIAWDDLHLDEAPLGRGTYGVVYKAMYRNTRVAVKRFLHQENYHEVVKEFKREARLLASLRHPNLVLFMGACYEKNRIAIVTEFMPNGTLHSVLVDTEMDLEWSLRMRMLRDICCGMAFLHSNRPPILHRDLKSPNILVDADFRLKVADFGLTVLKGEATAAKKKKDLESTDSITFQGSLFWTAPEVMRNMPYTEQCDVYSFGIVAWEILSREQLYPEMHPLSVGYLVMVENYRPPIPEDLPEHLADILRNCWSPDPAVRPSFQSLLNTFEGLASPYLSNFINKLKEFQDMQRKEVDVQRDFSALLDDIAPEISPPTNSFAIVVADVDRWGSLWDHHPAAMVDAVRSYQMILRRNMRECSGFEANLEGRACLAAFNDVGDAARWAMRVQLACVDFQWPSEIKESAECPLELASDGSNLFCGFRVRIGIHYGEPAFSFNPLTRRITYHGPLVNYATHLSAEAMGGQILISPEAASELQRSTKFPNDLEPQLTYGGEAMILKKSIQVMHILPKRLLERKFDTTARQTEHINAELDLFGAFMSSHKWHIKHSEIQKTGYEIARGTAFVIYEATWRGMRVAVKKLDIRRVRGQQQEMEGLFLGGPAMGMGLRRSSNRPRLPGGGHTALLQVSTELSLIFSLHHPNLLLYMGAGANESSLYLVSELMERLSLHHILITRQERPEWDVRVRMLRDVANAFNYLHSFKPPILHGRFKLNSVLVSNAWQVKVSGYGMSRIFMPSPDAGTIDHTMAPEVMEGKPPATSSDIYSFGIVMWETLCGVAAFSNMLKDVDWVTKIVGGLRPSIPPLCPEWYSEIMSKCWSKDAASRLSFEEISLRFLSELGSTDGSSSQMALTKLGTRHSYGTSFVDEMYEDQSGAAGSSALPFSDPLTPAESPVNLPEARSPDTKRKGPRSSAAMAATPPGSLRRLQSSYL